MEQFRDSQYGSGADFARPRQSTLSPKIKIFFRHRMSQKEWASEILKGEAKRQAHRIRVLRLPVVLAALQEGRPTVDKATVAQAIESACRRTERGRR